MKLPQDKQLRQIQLNLELFIIIILLGVQEQVGY